MALDEIHQKRRRLSSGTSSRSPPPSAAHDSHAFVDLSGDCPKPESHRQKHTRSLSKSKASPSLSGVNLAQDSDMPPAEDVDVALARQLQAEFDRERMPRGNGGIPTAESSNRQCSGRVRCFSPFLDRPANQQHSLQVDETQVTLIELVKTFIELKCTNCETTLFEESDIHTRANDLLATSRPDGARLDCLSCHLPAPCPQIRTITIWQLLCFFDNKSKHNKALNTKLDPMLVGASKSSSAGNGTGYSGAGHMNDISPPGVSTLGWTFYNNMSDDGLGEVYDSDEDKSYPPFLTLANHYHDSDQSESSYGKAHTLGPAPETLPKKPLPSKKPSGWQPEHQTLQPEQSKASSEDDTMTLSVMTCLAKLLSNPEPESAIDGILPGNQLQALFLSSSILDRAADLLRNNNLEDVTNQASLYMSLTAFLKALSAHPETSTLIFRDRLIRSPGVNILQVSLGKAKLAASNVDTTQPLVQCMRELAIQADIMLKHQDNDAMDMCLFQSIKDLDESLDTNTGSHGKKKTPRVKKNDWHKEFAVAEVPDQDILAHHSLATKATTGSRALGQMKRIVKEIAQLQASLPDGIFVRYCETRPDVMKILIVGPKDTPYENGLFEFDLLCGPDFPQGPPKMDFRTTGGGQVHFNPNLYQCGKVCLSLLGTWAGESWDPKQSTLLQVVVSIQASKYYTLLMFSISQ